MDYSKHHDLSNGYNQHQRNFINSGFTRFDPIGNDHNPRLDYGLSKRQH